MTIILITLLLSLIHIYRRILDGAKHVGLQFLQQALIVSTHTRHLHHFIDSVRNAQHNAAHLATLIKRQLVVCLLYTSRCV